MALVARGFHLDANWIDKKRPDRFEIIGSAIVLIGVAVMFYFPR